MTLIDDYVIATAMSVIVASAIILATLLLRYNKMVKDADKSSRLAKDLWDSVNSRFSVVDARIIDLMAKTEVMSSRLATSQAILPPSQHPISTRPSGAQVSATTTAEPLGMAAQNVPHIGNTETEAKVLRFLVQGPRTSAQIKEEVGKSREHTARLMKMLFDRGLVIRNDRNKPYVYEITDSGRSYVAS